MKEGFYFPHFSNARRDRKIRRVMKDLGVEGYGIFFLILEVLREQKNQRYPLADIDLLADEFGVSEPKVRTIVGNYDLFTIEDNMFFSPKLNEFLLPFFEKRERAINAARKRWGTPLLTEGNANADANALQMQSISNTSKVNKSKVNKSKVKEKPTLAEVENYFIENGYSKKAAARAFNYYEAGNWHDSRGAPVKNWKQKMRGVWFKPENETANETTNKKPHDPLHVAAVTDYGQL